MPINCFEKYGVTKLKDRFNELVKGGMNEYEAARKVITEEHADIETRLNNARKGLGINPEPLTRHPDVSEQVKNITAKTPAQPTTTEPEIKIVPQEGRSEPPTNGKAENGNGTGEPIKPPAEPAGTPNSGGQKVGVHHAALTDLAARLGLKEPERAEHITPEEHAERGRKMRDAGAPVSEVDNKSNELDDRISLGRAYLEKYIDELNKIGKSQGEDSQEYKDKVAEIDALTDKVKKLGSKAGQSMTALQGQRDIDTGNFEAVKRQFKETVGTPSESQEKKIRELTDKNTELQKRAEEAEAKLIEATDAAIGDKGKSTSEKAKDIANKLRQKAKLHRPGSFSAATPASLVWDTAVEVVAKTIETGGKIADAIEAGIKHIKESDWYKGLSDDKKKQAEEDFEKWNQSNHNKPLTAEEKSIIRKEKELADLKIGIAKQKNPKRELTDREKELNEEIKDERERLGLTSSKQEKPLTEEEQMEVDNKELDDLQNKFSGKKDNKFSVDEAKSVWDYAKKNYLDKGIKYRDMIKQVSEDLGLSWKQVSEAITSPKTKPISDAMWKKQGELRRAQNVTKIWIDQQSRSIYVRALLKASAAVRGLQVFGHGGVFIGTHAGMTVAQPRTWKYTIPAFIRANKFAYGNEAAYERAMQELKSRPLYTRFERLGLKNNPDQVHAEEFQKSQTIFGGWLKKIGMQGIKGFNALKVLRQDLAEYHYNKLTDEQKKDDGAVRSIVRLVNNATGATNLKLPEWVNEVSFAGGMEAARWGKITRNPMRATAIAIKALTNPEKATTEEKVFAKVWASRVGEQIATYGSLLAANAVIQNIVNPNNPTNILHPDKKDWLLPKFGGVTIDPTSGMVSTINFAKQIAEIPFENKKELRGDTKTQAIGKALVGRVRGKLAPLYSTIWDMATQTDYSGNQLPLSNIKPDANHRNIGWLEYATERLPIPVAEALHSMFQSAHDNGTSPTEAHNIFQGLLIAAASGGTGVRASESGKEKPKSFTDEELKSPVLKKWVDKGYDMPNVYPTSITVKDKSAHVERKLSEYPKEIVDTYKSTHNEIFINEMKQINDRGYVWVTPYGHVLTVHPKHSKETLKKVNLDDLTDEQNKEVLSNSQKRATVAAKKKVNFDLDEDEKDNE